MAGLGDKYRYQCNELEPEWADQIENADEVTSIDAKLKARDHHCDLSPLR